MSSLPASTATVPPWPTSAEPRTCEPRLLGGRRRRPPYVFLHLLPEIAAGNEAIGEALSDVLAPTPLLELAIFLVALTGFTAFYGLERLATVHGSRQSATRPSAAPERGGARGPAGVYWLHLASFMVYNVLITYTMVLRVRTGLLFAPTSTLLVALLTALLGGSVLLNVFKEEIPTDRGSSFAWFTVGLVLYSVLLAVITGIEE